MYKLAAASFVLARVALRGACDAPFVALFGRKAAVEGAFVTSAYRALARSRVLARSLRWTLPE